MKIGVPKEVKTQEHRVGLLPSGVYQLVKHGHEVLVECCAGTDAGYTDHDYVSAGRDPGRQPRRRVRGRPRREGQGADSRRVRPAPFRPVAFHLPAPRRQPRVDHGAAEIGRHRHCLRDGHAQSAPAAARANERDRRAHVGHRRRPFPRQAAWGQGRAARRRAGRAAGPGRRARRRHLGRERGAHGHRPSART